MNLFYNSFQKTVNYLICNAYITFLEKEFSKWIMCHQHIHINTYLMLRTYGLNYNNAIMFILLGLVYFQVSYCKHDFSFFFLNWGMKHQCGQRCFFNQSLRRGHIREIKNIMWAKKKKEWERKKILFDKVAMHKTLPTQKSLTFKPSSFLSTWQIHICKIVP